MFLGENNWSVGVKQMKDFAIIGLGRFGSALVQTLADMGHQVLAIDISEERVQYMSEIATHAVQADAMDEEILKELGIKNFDVVVVAIGHDVQASILVALLLKEMGVKTVVAKALNAMHGKVLEKIGVDKVVYPERDMAIRLAHHLVTTNFLDSIELSEDYSIFEIKTPARMVGKSLGQLALRAKCGISIIAIKTPERIIAAPGAEDVLGPDDILVAIGKKKNMERLEEA